jgi:hypothetical protein
VCVCGGGGGEGSSSLSPRKLEQYSRPDVGYIMHRYHRVQCLGATESHEYNRHYIVYCLKVLQ